MKKFLALALVISFFTVMSNAEAGESFPTSDGNSNLCNGKRVFIVMFGPDQRQVLSDFRESLIGLGADVPAIEDALVSAHRSGKTPISIGKTSYVLIHDNDDAAIACAQAIVEFGRGLQYPGNTPSSWPDPRPLPAKYSKRKGEIDVWIGRPDRPSLDDRLREFFSDLVK